MAIFRKVHVSFWSDPFVEALTPEQKYFYLYLLTNEKTKQCGIYEITKRKIANDTGYNLETVDKLIMFFQNLGKLIYSNNTGEIALKNWPKYNDSKSPKVRKCIDEELKFVKNKVLIQYLYSIDTQSQEEEEQEKEKEREYKPSIENSNLFRKPKIPTFDEVHRAFLAQGGTKEQAEAFFNKHSGTEWFLNGSPIVNFTSLIPNFLNRWKENEQRNSRKRSAAEQQSTGLEILAASIKQDMEAMQRG